MLARGDLANIDDYQREWDPNVANRLGNDLLNAARIFEAHPLAGPLAMEETRRKWRVRGTPYSLFYSVRSDHIRILRVLHHAQDVNRH